MLDNFKKIMDVDIITKKETLITNSISICLNDFKFNKAGMIWWKKVDDILIMINFQKSKWENEFYLNFGFYFEGLRPLKKRPPKDYDWHLWGRFDSILDISSEECKQLCQYENYSLQELEKNCQIICKYLKETIIPKMMKLASYKYLAQHFKIESRFDGYLIQNIKSENLKKYFEDKVLII